ncbi:MAG TPA: CinA family protein [Methylobacter sp.]|jgi:nicotinamide mononucleotide (NMN) deamidase PncC
MDAFRLSHESISELLNKDRSISIVATGVGAGLQRILWDVPGISKVLHSADFPYSRRALDRYLGYSPGGRYCSEETTVAMAMEAYRRAWTSESLPTIGLAISGSVASLEEHMGDHRIYVAIMTDNYCRISNLTLKKGAGRDARESDGLIADIYSLNMLLSAIDGTSQYQYSVSDRVLNIKASNCIDICQNLIEEFPFFSRGKRLSGLPLGDLTILPGAFNPPHPGHLWLAHKHRAIFHVCTNPPHKAALSPMNILQRAKMLEDEDIIFSSKDPFYLDKAQKYPGCRIVIGADAFVRMLDPKWGIPIEPMLYKFASLGTKFLVADRVYDGKLVTLDDIVRPLPSGLCERIETPPEYSDMSSTALRAAANKR